MDLISLATSWLLSQNIESIDGIEILPQQTSVGMVVWFYYTETGEDLPHFLTVSMVQSLLDGKNPKKIKNEFDGKLSLNEPINKINNLKLKAGFPTHSFDITGKQICLGDIVDYDFEGDDPCPFEVVFEDNAFRKKYKKWDETLTKPILEFGESEKNMKLKIIKSYNLI
jgi:hypothetical protein